LSIVPLSRERNHPQWSGTSSTSYISTATLSVSFVLIFASADNQAGEDLHEDDDDEDEDGLPTVSSNAGQIRGGPSDEREPLLGRGSLQRSKSHKRSKSGPPVGTASVTQATLMVSIS